MGNLVEITESVHDIAQRIKAIDDDYKIFWNYKSKKYELHNLRSKPTKQFDLPFKQLTKKVVDYVYSTRVDNIINEVMSIDDFNAELEKRQLNSTIDKATYIARDLMKYIHNGGSEIPPINEL